jgi:hypothetical protein
MDAAGDATSAATAAVIRMDSGRDTCVVARLRPATANVSLSPCKFDCERGLTNDCDFVGGIEGGLGGDAGKTLKTPAKHPKTG